MSIEYIIAVATTAPPVKRKQSQQPQQHHPNNTINTLHQATHTHLCYLVSPKGNRIRHKAHTRHSTSCILVFNVQFTTYHVSPRKGINTTHHKPLYRLLYP